MESIQYVAKKLEEYKDDSNRLNVPLTPRRIRELKTILRMNYENLMNLRLPATELSRMSIGDLQDVGEMDYLLTNCFPDGNVPEEFKKYEEFVGMIKHLYGSTYDSILEKKLIQDKEIIDAVKSGKPVLEIENPVYASSLVSIVEAEEIIRDKSRIVILYDGEQLYEENIRSGSFDELPQGSVAIFDYTPQGLMLNLKRTMEENQRAKDKVEKALIKSLSEDSETKGYMDDLYDQINRELK